MAASSKVVLAGAGGAVTAVTSGWRRASRRAAIDVAAGGVNGREVRTGSGAARAAGPRRLGVAGAHAALGRDRVVPMQRH